MSRTFASLLALAFSLLLPAPALAGDGEKIEAERANEAANEAIVKANQAVLQEIKKGNRDPDKLMKLMAPAIKARSEALERKAKAQYDDDQKEGQERMNAQAKADAKKKPGGSGAKSATRPAPATGGGTRYGAGTNEAPIMDPNSVAKEMSFEKKAPKGKAPAKPGPVEAAAPALPDKPPATGGVDEISF